MKISDFFGVKVVYDDMGQFIWGVEKNGNHQKIADLRGWGAIQNLFKRKDHSINIEKAEKFQQDLGAWIVDAINEKLQRESAPANTEAKPEYLILSGEGNPDNEYQFLMSCKTPEEADERLKHFKANNYQDAYLFIYKAEKIREE